MFSNNLKKVVTRRKKRVGRGGGSGKGFHTSGRGQKGQTSRSGYHEKRSFVGGQNPINRAFPRRRTLSRKSVVKPVSISISVPLAKGTYEITSEVLTHFSRAKSVILVGPKSYKDIDLKKVNIEKGIAVSKSLKEKILAAGGKVEE